jgi:hypothetical protein
MIVICEPHFCGFGHAQFNAALVCSVAEAFPEEGLIFCAEREHLNHVKREVDTRAATVRFIEVGLPDRALREEQRGRRLPFTALLEELALYRRIFRLADKNRASQIVFCTAAHRNDLQNKISTPQPKRLTLEFLSYRHWLLAGNTAKIHYLLPGPPPLMEQGLKNYLPRLHNCISPIDVPYVFADSAGSQPFKDDVVHFGFFGHASLRKGADIFFKLAEEVSATRTKYRPIFVLIGDIRDEQLKEMRHASINIPALNAPLTQEEFDKYSKRIDYAFFFHVASAYELNGTAAMLDAFSHLKPIIALKTPLSEYYFNKMGDVGYLCQSYNDAIGAVMEILETRPLDRYHAQQENILKKRDQFSPAGIAPKLRVLLREKAA